MRTIADANFSHARFIVLVVLSCRMFPQYVAEGFASAAKPVLGHLSCLGNELIVTFFALLR
jgi:hypothetical protein